jgi:phosphate transport system substrate-binding protein
MSTAARSQEIGWRVGTAALLGLTGAIGTGGCRCNRGPLEIEVISSTHARPLLAKLFSEYHDPSVRFATASLGAHESARKKLVEKEADFFVAEGPVPLVGQPDLRARPIVVPLAIGGVAVVYNLPGAAPLRLTPEALVDVFLGKLTRWDDVSLTSVEGNARLPASAISVVHRSDQSGTTALFAQYAAEVRPEWTSSVGQGLVVKWPGGISVEGTDGVIEAVRAHAGSIAILPASIAAEAKLAMAAIGNPAGRFVAPDAASLTAAGVGVEWAPQQSPPSLIRRSEPGAYPLSCFIYVVFDEARLAQPRVEGLARFLSWAMNDGQRFAGPLQFGALPSTMASTYAPGLRELTQEKWAPPAL